MAINVEISRTGTENSSNLLRRFSKRVMESGIISHVKSSRYKSRILSHYKTKKKTLSRIERHKEIENLIKMGKINRRVRK